MRAERMMTERPAMIRDIGSQQILDIDLSSGQTAVEELPVEELLRFLGGRGIAAKILYEQVPPGIDPLGPENVLIFNPGTLTGTSAPSSGRCSITCKGPATGLYLKVSAGGHLGAELKYAGFDYVVIRGVAEHPVYLWITNGAVEIRDARHLWGLGTREADRLIKAELGDEEIILDMRAPWGIGGLDPREHASAEVGKRNVELASKAIGEKARELLNSLPPEHRSFSIEAIKPGNWWLV